MSEPTIENAIPALQAVLDSVERVEVEPHTMAGFRRESEFTDLAFNLLREAASLVVIAGSTRTSEFWSRDQAAVGGNMLRLHKLLDAILDQSAKDRREVPFLLSRLVWETSINVRYLMDNFNAATVDSYVRHSLQHERKVHDQIQSNIAARGGEVLPIETRMLNSINKAARFANVTIDSIDPTDRRPWGGLSTKQKAAALGLEHQYLAAFGAPSHEIHGGWMNLYQYHLTAREPDRFEARTEWRQQRPQILLGLSRVVAETVKAYFGFLGLIPVRALIASRIDDLQMRIQTTDDAHEAFLNRS